MEARIEQALEAIEAALDKWRDEGRSEQAYQVAMLLMADAICDANEPIIN